MSDQERSTQRENGSRSLRPDDPAISVPDFAWEVRSLSQQVPVGNGWITRIARMVQDAADNDLGTLFAGFGALRSVDVARLLPGAPENDEERDGYVQGDVSVGPEEFLREEVRVPPQPLHREDEILPGWLLACSRMCVQAGMVGGALFGALLAWGFRVNEFVAAVLISACVGAAVSRVAFSRVAYFSPSGRRYSTQEVSAKCLWAVAWVFIAIALMFATFR